MADGVMAEVEYVITPNGSSAASDGPAGSDDVLDRARVLLQDIAAARPTLKAKILNELAVILEDEEARYAEQTGYSGSSRSSHTIGRILSLIRDDDEFFDLISSKLLLEGQPCERAAAARVLLSCVSCWMYPYVFDDAEFSMIEKLVMEDLTEATEFNRSLKNESNSIDSQALKTYAMGLLACALTGADVVEDVLNTGLSSKLIRFLRISVFSEPAINGKSNITPLNKSEGGHRTRQPVDTVHIEEVKQIDSAMHKEKDVDLDDEKLKKEIHEGKLRNHEERRKNDRKSRGRSTLDDTSAPQEAPKELIQEKGDKVGDAAAVNEAREIVFAGTAEISAVVWKAVAAAQQEARTANAPDGAITAAGDAAAELVKAAAAEALENKCDDEAILAAANAAADTIIDAADATNRHVFTDVTTVSEVDQNAVDDCDGIWDNVNLGELKERYCIQCLEKLGAYVEVLGSVLQERGADVCVALLKRYSQKKDSSFHMATLSDVLKLICALTGHRKFAEKFLELGGFRKVLATPLVPQTLTGISMALVAFANPSLIEGVWKTSYPCLQEAIALAFHILDCSQDAARKNAVLFFAGSLGVRAVVDAFDSQDGLRRLMTVLRNTVALRSGGSSGSGIPRIDNRGAAAEVLTSCDKQIAYHVCVTLRQYFRAHLLIVVDSLKVVKGRNSSSRSSMFNPYKPLDVTSESIETVVQQLYRDRKLGPAFAKAKWPALDNFMKHNGHVILLELTQAAPGEKYLHEIAQHVFVVLQIVTLVPGTRKAVVGSTLSNERPGMAVILDAASGAAFVEPEVIQAALLVLINLVCPPPALSRSTAGPHTPAANAAAAAATPSTTPLQNNNNTTVNSERASDTPHKTEPTTPASALIGDSRISLGPGSGGLAAYMEQSFRYAREAVRANNGIKALLHLLLPRTVLPLSAHDCIRALACRVLLGMARDDAIAQILTKLQVGKLLSELLRDGSILACRQVSSGGETGRWQAELSQAALDLMGIVTNAGRASTVASEAAAPTLRRIERAAIAAATPINYHSTELLQLIHEHLLASGLSQSAAALLKEAHLTPLQLSLPIASLPQQLTTTTTGQQEGQGDSHKSDFQWPIRGVVLPEVSTRKKVVPVTVKTPTVTPKRAAPAPSTVKESRGVSFENQPTKRKSIDNALPVSPNKRPHLSDHSGCATPHVRFRNNFTADSPLPVTGVTGADTGGASTNSGITAESSRTCEANLEAVTPVAAAGTAPTALEMAKSNERATLDSLVGQYLKHQHRQCPAPITTLPPLSLLHPHVCPEPSRALYAPYNTASRLGMREIVPPHGGIHGRRHNRHLVYSRFRQVRTCRDEPGLVSCATFLGGGSTLAVGYHTGEIWMFDPNTGTSMEHYRCHATPVCVVQSGRVTRDSGGQLLLSSTAADVRLWNSSSMDSGALHAFDGHKSARFNNSGSMFGALKVESPQKEVLLYDVATCALTQTLTINSLTSPPTRLHQAHPIVHFSPSDVNVLWSGFIWDHRIPNPVHRFDQFTDYGGGGFHPAGNEVIINSEVWDLRTFKLLRSVPSLDQTVINFNATGDVMYCTLRRNTEDITSALHSRRTRHPLFSAFKTMDAVDYTDIATTQLDRCVLDLATEPTDSLIAVVSVEATQVMDSVAKIYEVGRRRVTEDDSDPEESDEDEDDDDSDDGDDDEEDDGVAAMQLQLDDGDSDIDLLSNGDDDEDDEDDEDDDDDGDGGDGDDGIGDLMEMVDVGDGDVDVDGDGEGSDDEDDDGDENHDFNVLLSNIF